MLARITRRRSLAGLGAALTCGSAAFSQEAGRSFPFQFKNGQAIVTLRLDDQRPLRFLLDSGAQYPAVSEDVARSLRLQRADVAYVGGEGGSRAVSVYLANTVAVADSFLIRDVRLWGLPSLAGQEIDGVFPPFLLHTALIDFVGTTITVFPDRSPVPPRFTLFPQIPASLQRTTDRRPVIEAKLDGRPVILLADTGYGGLLELMGAYVGKEGLWNRDPREAPHSVEGAIGAGSVSRVKVREFNLGGLKFPDFPVDLHRPDDDTHIGNAAQGVLGMRLLQYFDIWIDAPGSQFGLRPTAKASVLRPAIPTTGASSLPPR